ncbi:hypothetical protein CDL15_Pgr019303 [Punica granatum]|uniref:Uncharacterized protein n=1 Tax=Punica granatum TaxID=22663 RepID=A0A218XRF9_PUNGR|nr:hypothetical protein CDL15_Pgr019303 [Punica granatum]
MGVCGRGQPLGGRRKRPQSTSALLMAREGRSSGTTNAGLRSQAQYRAPATQIRPIVVLEPRLFGLPSSPSHGSAIVDSQGSWGCISGHGSLKPWPLAFGSSPSESRSRFWDTASPVRGYRSRLQLNPEPSRCSWIPVPLFDHCRSPEPKPSRRKLRPAACVRRHCQGGRDRRAWWLSGSMGGGGARVCWLGVRSRAEKVKLTQPGSISISPDPI